MLKHRGFPSRLPSTDYQFTIRRANAKGATKLVARERYRDRSAADRRADAGFLRALIENFGEEEFERGNLDAGRISWLLGRELVAVGKLDPTSYEQLFRVDLAKAQASFPELFVQDDAAPEENWEDDWNEDGDDEEEDEDRR